MEIISINDIKRSFNNHFSLWVRHLVVNENEIFTIMGPNGAGKTTLLRIIAMLEKQDTGSIRIFGREIKNTRDNLLLRRNLSFVFSQPLFVNDTVYNNISLPLRLRGIKDPGYIKEMLNLLGIDHLRNSPAPTLSNGERYKVSIARALVTRPRLLLLDEPFTSLDKNCKEKLLMDLKKLKKANNMAIIFVTQDQYEALSLSSHMAIMKDGKIIETDTPQKIFARIVSKDAPESVGVRG